ncbi:penicillin acylase family protein [Rathayibacter soli]|uniref:penicillin acylase family protein n=1 Tax=Rathayibacter soli TaxID=3144168 RepID=UPI0027E50E86|nr:penicillin acylase family protein [Glaciibacter superstes]
MGTDEARIGRRHPFWRVMGILLAIVATLAIVAGVLGFWTVTRSFPTLEGNVDLPGLNKPVTVQRDDAGIPQITAQTSHDLFMAEGYVHAQDRFWEMDFRRHVTAGRLAELFGKSQVGTDAFIRTLGWRTVAEQEVKAMDKTSLSYYQAYADGVNAYLKTHKGADLSLEYAVLGLQVSGYTPEKWTPVDSVAWLKAMAWDLRSNLEDEIDRAVLATKLTPAQVAQLHPDYPYAQHPTITGLGGGSDTTVTTDAKPAVALTTPGDTSTSVAADALAPLEELQTTMAAVPELLGPAGNGIGSNSWVVAGSHTATGKPLLANDPHLGPVMPSIWYQVGLHCATVSAACPFDVAGYSFSGLPGVVIGHNNKIAWGFTNLGPDVADLYLEKVSDKGYEYDGAIKPFVERTETIKVAGAPAQKLTIKSTDHGPIVTGITTDFGTIAQSYSKAHSGIPAGKYQLSLQWTALQPGHTAQAIFAMNKATNWTQFRAAAADFDVPSQNLVYADVEGNIGYQAPGRIPIRKQGNGTLPVPGWTSSYGWSGYVPFDQLPSVYNPPKGYIVTANNAAVGPEYPVMITQDWDSGYRANQITNRLQTLLTSGKKISAADMSSIQADKYDANAATLAPLLVSLHLNGAAGDAISLLKGWNYHDDPDSAAAAYFNVFWRNLLHDAFGRKMPASAQPVGGDRWFQVVGSLVEQPESPWWTDSKLGVAGLDEMLTYSARQAAEEATDLMGSDPSSWRWDSIHQLELTNASFGESGIAPIEWLFNRGPYPVGGASSVVDAVGWDASVGYQVNWVPSMRQVIDLSNFDASTWINLTGESGHAFHPNYVDQAPLWQTNRTRPWAFSAGAVRAATTNTLTLKP